MKIHADELLKFPNYCNNGNYVKDTQHNTILIYNTLTGNLLEKIK